MKKQLYKFLCLLFFCCSKLIVWSNSLSFDFGFKANLSYYGENNDYQLQRSEEEKKKEENKSGEIIKWEDFGYKVSCDFTLKGGELFGDQFKTVISLDADATKNDTILFEPEQLFVQLPVQMFIFISLGIKKINFGEGVFFNFSNRIKAYKANPYFIQFDCIIHEYFSFGLLGWFDNIKRWEQVKTCLYSEFNLSFFYLSLHFFVEDFVDLEYWRMFSLGINSSFLIKWFKVYFEGHCKGRSDQYYYIEDDNEFQQNIGLYYALTHGLQYKYSFFRINVEYSYQNEGLSEAQKDKYINLIKQTKKYNNKKKHLKFYDLKFFGSHYMGTRITFFKVFIPKLSINIENLYCFDNIGGKAKMSVSYDYNSNSSFGIQGEYYYGHPERNYRLFEKSTFSVTTFLSFNY